ncbi:MAG: nicotianamine synthase [Kineosporiaceae bacterium]|nr:nicotianamine synthase [Kineosporiaceae bacterium]
MIVEQPLAQRIISLYHLLRARPNLAPSPVVNALFAELVRCVTDPGESEAAVLAHQQVGRIRPHLLELCALGEGLLEAHWARQIIGSPHAAEELGRFPYVENYAQLTRLELHALAASGLDGALPRRVCFIGGGPLPLTALELARAGVAVRVLDKDGPAVDLACDVVRRLDPEQPVEVVLADARRRGDLGPGVEDCEVVIVAALVGLTRADKHAVLRSLAAVMPRGARVLMRSAHGLRALLYPVVEVDDVRAAGFRPCVLVHPFGEVVNSVLVAGRP